MTFFTRLPVETGPISAIVGKDGLCDLRPGNPLSIYTAAGELRHHASAIATNDMGKDLEKHSEGAGERRALVVTDGVFSMGGGT